MEIESVMDHEHLLAQKRELLAQLLAEAGLELPQEPGILPADRTERLPLSFTQERFWFLDQFAPGSPAYNIPTTIRLDGELDPGVLEQAMNEVVRRHESLRTTFVVYEDQPVQVIAPKLTISMPLIDLRGQDADEQAAAVEHLARQEMYHAFDLAQGPLVCTRLLRLSDQTHILLLTLHHIVSDGWSVGVCIRELAIFYTALTTGATASLPPLPIQFADFAVWQRHWLQDETLDQLLSYWRQQLAGAPTTLALSTDRPRPATQTFRGARQTRTFSPALTTALTALGQREAATLFMTLLAAFKALLYRATGQDDILVGSPIANRNRAEIEGLIGAFVNTLILRTRLHRELSFRELVVRVRDVALDAYKHQDLPFEKLVMDIQPDRDLSRNAMVQVLFALQHPPSQDMGLPNLTLQVLPSTSGLVRFDLECYFQEQPDGLLCELEYNIDLFEDATIARMLDHFHVLLQAIVEQPDLRLCDLPLLSAQQRQQILYTWNATALPYPEQRCIHELIEAQVLREPLATAVVFEQDSLTYDALNRRANQLARYLQTCGVGPEVRVGICMERSLELMVALLGVLKAGGAYVPLDPTYPAERVALMMEDAQLAIVLTQEWLQERLPKHYPAQIITLSSDWLTILDEDDQNIQSAALPDNVAYTIYTSGSSGQPKGVMVLHRNVANFFSAMDQHIHTDPPGVWLALTSVSFDISVLELLWTLTRGFQVVIQAASDTATALEDAHAAAIDRDIAFSLFYFASDEGESQHDKYHFLIEGAKFADQHGFAAVWTPERHFHAFGGLYPNPVVTSAALATITERIQIRAGSVVLPLHDSLRVAEEWSVVDNLSHGRVGISVASGWHANDFVFAPDDYADRTKIMFREIETLRKLWRGEEVVRRDGADKQIAVRILPRPVQTMLPIWVTAAGSPATFESAGTIGAHLLTHLLGQDIEELAGKIKIYRDAWQQHGHGPGEGHVTLMLHTFVGDDLDAVRERVRVPFSNYLKSSLDLTRNLAKSLGWSLNQQELTADDQDALLAYAFDRYFEGNSLLGTVDSCLRMVDRLKAIGVDEIACLIDFGVETDVALAGLQTLNQLREKSQRPRQPQRTTTPLHTQMLHHQVSHLQCTPSMARMLLDPSAQQGLASLKQILVGGEALPAPLVAQLSSITDAPIHNMYGPTETTIWSTTQRVHPKDAVMTIGRPIANTEIYIVDQFMEPVLIGEPGELLIGGAGIVRGYLDRPALTAARFVPDPWGGRQGARLYRTGDLARYQPDGTIVFLGRMDYQVKVRGYRIELEEIEAVLAAHPTVRQAVVLAREDTPGDTRLVAYIVAQPEQTANTQELRSWLKQKLPDYMVPSIIMTLAALPLTPNQKIDRRALPAPTGERPELAATFVEPRTAVEQDIARIWSHLLHVERIGVSDNFFEIGGHSLLVIQVMAQVRATFQIDMPLRSFFEAPTIERFAKRIEAVATQQEERAPQLVRRPQDVTVPLSFAQEGLWMLDQIEPGNTRYNMPLVMRLSGPLDVVLLEQSFSTIVRRHESLRTCFVVVDQQPAQVVMPVRRARLELLDLQALPLAQREAEGMRLAVEEGKRPFDLAHAPLLRIKLLRLTDQEHILLLTAHHIIADGWSWGILFQELAALYGGSLSGDPVTLPELPIQYADFALWQRQRLAGAALHDQMEYWQKYLADAPPMTTLPTDYPRQTTGSSRGATESIRLADAVGAGIQQLSRQESSTLFITLLAAFNVLLYRYSGQEDLVVGSPIANRDLPETQQLIGLFTDLLVTRVRLSGTMTFHELLAQMYQTVLDGYAHAEMPFTKIVEAVQPERRPGCHPLFQIMFNLQNIPQGSMSLPNLTLTTLHPESGGVDFDLVWTMSWHESGVTAFLEYNTQLFQPTTIRRMLSHFATLLEGIIADPNQPIAQIPLLTAAERTQAVQGLAVQRRGRLPAHIKSRLESLVKHKDEQP